jgi:hypothetical protein
LRAIVAFGILAGIGLLLQLANASPKIFPFTNLVIVGAPPDWVRGLEHFAIIGVVTFYGSYLGFLTLWLAFKSLHEERLMGEFAFGSRLFFGLGTFFFVFGLVAFFIRMLY